jgi:hypothetical protein
MGIDIAGRAEFFGNAGKRNGFDAQFGIMAGEEFHDFFSSATGCGAAGALAAGFCSGAGR